VPPRQAAALTFRRFGRRILGRKASNRVKASKSRPPIEFLKKTRRTVNAAVYFSKACCYVCDMNKAPPSSAVLQRLRTVGLRPTRQRLALARLLFESGHRHITAEHLHGEAMDAGIKVSLATVYNTLHQFTEAGLLREAMVEPGRSYFDTNTADHHHFFCETTGELRDIPAHHLSVSGLPTPPSGTEIRRVDIIVRVRSESAA
jgi:Fur family transcriptional regulator, iron response regulator